MNFSHSTSRPMDLLPPGRLVVGIISPGKMGFSFAQALNAVGHVVEFTYQHDYPNQLDHFSSRERSRPLSEAKTTSLEKLATLSELIILTVPDSVLPHIIKDLAPYTNANTIVVHTSCEYGLEVFKPLLDNHVRTIAIHPVLHCEDFQNSDDRNHYESLSDDESLYNLSHRYFIVTAPNEVDCMIGQSLVLELHSTPIVVLNQHRRLCFEAISEAKKSLYLHAKKAIAAFSGAINAEQSNVFSADNLAMMVLEPIFYQSIDCALNSTNPQILFDHNNCPTENNDE